MRDIVYFVKDAEENEELRYSLRSIEKNFKEHGTVWFIGGCPEGLRPDRHMPFKQEHGKYGNVRAMLEIVLRSDEISDEFYLFNDDFFIMRSIKEIPYIYDGSIQKRVDQILKRHGRRTYYTSMLRRTIKRLERDGCTTLNYGVHIPMLIDKSKALKVCSRYDKSLSFRNIYGNCCGVGGEQREDCKVVDLQAEPNKALTYLSTSDESFESGLIGEYIRGKFKKPSRWEESDGKKQTGQGRTASGTVREE